MARYYGIQNGFIGGKNLSNYENIRPYAEFAHFAAQNGGVEKCLKDIAESNYALGVMDEKSTEAWKAVLVIAGTLALEEGVRWGIKKLKEYNMKKREEAVQKSEAAKSAIIEGVAEAKAAGLVDEDSEE